MQERKNFVLFFKKFKKFYCMKFLNYTVIFIFFLILNHYFFLKKNKFEHIMPLNEYFFHRTLPNKKNEEKNFLKNIENHSPHYIIFHGLLENNFIDSAKKIGLLKREISFIINLTESKINFKNLKTGDRFTILKNKKEKNQILAVHIRNNKKDYYAIRAENNKFYDQNGLSITHNFICFPTLKSYRISSNFNLHRMHPITGRMTPHKGVDFALPIGTKIFSVGDGKIIFTGHSKEAGNYIVIQHNNKCVTRYMHLKKILVHKGQKIKKGDNIALSGNTGRSTGPHLHYEIWINNKAVNPLKSKLLFNEKLKGAALKLYLYQVKKITSKLNKLQT